MESTVENDLQRLEEWLDGCASPQQADALSRRVAAEPALADLLDRLKAERESRRQVWSFIEPTQADAERCCDALMRRIHHGEPRRRIDWMTYLRGSAVAAACAGFFLAGWAVRGRSASSSIAPSTPVADARGNGRTTWDLSGQTPRNPVNDNLVHVAVTDESGNVIAVQKFNQVGPARQFADDLARWQARRQQAQQGRYLRVADEF